MNITSILKKINLHNPILRWNICSIHSNNKARSSLPIVANVRHHNGNNWNKLRNYLRENWGAPS